MSLPKANGDEDRSPKDGVVTMRPTRSLGVALFVGGVIFCAACGGGGGSSGPGPGPVITPTPTPFPTFTQGPTPAPLCASAQPNPLTEPLVLATPMKFPDASGYCGQIVFPAGSTPVSGNSVTLSTSINAPGGYPTSIPPGPGNYGVGTGSGTAVAVAPWLTYSVAKSLSTGGQNPQIQVTCPPCQQNAFYYIAVWDLTHNSGQPIVTFPAPFTALPPSSVGRRPLEGARRGRFAVPPFARTRLHTRDLAGGDQYYIGVFMQPDSTNVNVGLGTLDGAGSSFTLPPADGFSGSVPYGANTGPSGTLLQLISANVDVTGGYIPPLNTYGVPVFWENFYLESGSTAVTFNGSVGTVSLNSTSIQNGASYDIYWYDWTNVNPSNPAQLLLSTIGAVATQGTLTFPSLFGGGFTFQGDHNIMLEVVKEP